MTLKLVFTFSSGVFGLIEGFRKTVVSKKGRGWLFNLNALPRICFSWLTWFLTRTWRPLKSLIFSQNLIPKNLTRSCHEPQTWCCSARGHCSRIQCPFSTDSSRYSAAKDPSTAFLGAGHLKSEQLVRPEFHSDCPSQLAVCRRLMGTKFRGPWFSFVFSIAHHDVPLWES